MYTGLPLIWRKADNLRVNDRNHIREVNSMSKKGDMGIGTLILFIAFILVAAVAAGVLVSTTSALQSKALTTGKAATAEVGTSMVSVELYAEDASNDRQVDYFYWTVKLSSGSDEVKFSDLLLTMNTNNVSRQYTVNTSIGCSATGELDTYSSKFGINYSLQSSNSITGYMVSGDVVQLCFKSPRSIIENEDVKINLIPKVGSTLSLTTSMPALMLDARIYIYP